MDARDSSLATPGSTLSSFYIQHRPGTPAPPSGLHAPHPHPGGGYRHHVDAAGAAFSFQTPHMGMGANPHIGQGQALHVETSPPMSQPSAGAGIDSVKGEQGSGGGVIQGEQQVKRKRGRPRKYKPDGTATVTLGLSPSTPPSSSSAMVTASTTPGSGGPPEKRRGRPPGSGKMQQLASLGKCFLGSVGTGFTPHVIIISSGEDVAARIMSFSQQGPRAVCIMSATGAISTATLHQDASTGSVVTYEGQFEILCLSGSYLVIDDGVSRTRSGGLCIALCGPDHRVIGGSVGGVLTAAGTVQVIVGSFMYVGSKKNKGKAEQEEETEEANGGGEEETSLMLTMAHEDLSSHSMSGWPGMLSQMDSRSSNIDINSIRE